MPLGDNVSIQVLIHTFNEMDAEDFELAIEGIILLRRVRSLKENLENNGFGLYLQRGKKKVHISNL